MIKKLVETKAPILSVCVCALESRKQQSKKLFDHLSKQAKDSGCAEVLIAHDCGQSTSGEKRHTLSVESSGKYISFVDDDDSVSDTYIEKIVSGCSKNPHVVTFNVLVIQEANKNSYARMNLHTLTTPREVTPYGKSTDEKYGEVFLVGMFPSHLCAWRRDIQRKIAYNPQLNCKDDAAWIEPMIAANLATIEHRISEVLYFYHYSNSGTTNQTEQAKQKSKSIIGNGFECFREGDNFFISHDPLEKTSHKSNIVCRDCNNNLVTKRRENMICFHVYKFL